MGKGLTVVLIERKEQYSTLPLPTLRRWCGARTASIYVYGTKKIYMHFVQKQTLCFCHFKRTQERIFAATASRRRLDKRSSR